MAVLFFFCGALMQLTPAALRTDRLTMSLPCVNYPLSLSYEGNDLSSQGEDSPQRLLNARLMLLGTFPVKDVSVSLESRRYVIPGGTPFGIRLYTDGLVVSHTTPVYNGSREEYPAQEAGIEQGDVILSVNGRPLTSNEQLLTLVEQSGGMPVTMEIQHNNRNRTVSITPVLDSANHEYRTGLYVRDSCAGLGTMTFIDPETGSFAGLGHGICDAESGRLMPLLRGDIVPAEITSVRKSTCGNPGTLVGHFSGDESLGSLALNSEHGVYGTLRNLPAQTETVPVAYKQEVVRGKAVLLSSVDGGEPVPYAIEIEDISYNNRSNSKNMIIRITDERLLRTAGGIVQGMSGSPILQNGRLAGAVTHVFVNDTVRGYAVFAENMMEMCDNLQQTIHDNAA